MIEMELGDEALNAVLKFKDVKFNINAKSNCSEFDDYGSLHLSSYDANGQMLDDFPLRQEDIESLQEPAYDNRELREYIDSLKRESSRSNIRFIISMVLVGSLTIVILFLPFVLKYLGG